MKREIREVDPVRRIVCITSPDERFYARQVNQESGDTVWDFVPSCTWISGNYPKGVQYYKWLASKGWSEAEEIKALAGDKGTKVHQAISVLIRGGTVQLADKFENPRTMEPEELTPDEYFCLMTFCEWCAKEKPQFIANEYTVWNERYRYAGTIDIKCRMRSTRYAAVHIIDVKTSSDVWPSMELQVSAYKHADPDVPRSKTGKPMVKLGILQVGYKRNKKQKYKYTEVSDQFSLFLAARRIWKKECETHRPFQREYPLELSLGPLGVTAAA